MSKGTDKIARVPLIDFGEAPLAVIKDVADPPGFNRQAAESPDTFSRAVKVKEVDSGWKQLKAWEAAQAPGKNILMLAFMMWMAGSTPHIFSMGIVASALWQPISALRNLNRVFEPFKDRRVDLLTPKFVFVVIQLVALGIGLWKLHALGLLPTHTSDWLTSLPPPTERLDTPTLITL